MRIPTYILIILIVFISAVTQAELRVYTGTIANQPVIVELSFNEQHVIDSGRYAYVKYGKIIQLEADRESAGILKEQVLSADESEQIIVAKWQLKQEGERLLGLWQSTAGKTAAIQLQPAKNQSESVQSFHVLLAQQSPALQLKIQQGKTQAGTATNQLVWQQGVHFKAQGIQIKKITASGDAAINQSLKTMLQYDIGAAQDCFSNRPDRSDFSNWTDILYANPRVLTITRHFDIYCGGAYPNNWIERHSFDRKSGLELQIDQQIYQFEAENADAFRQLLLKTWQNNECKIKDQTCRQEVAEEFRVGFFSLSAYGIVKTGIIVHIGYPHVAQAGDTDLIIPFAALRPFKRANAPIDPEHWQ